MLLRALPLVQRRRRGTRRYNFDAPQPVPSLVVTGVVYVSDLGTFLEVLLGVNTTGADPLLDASGANPAKWTARMSGNVFTGISVATDAYDRLLLFLEQTGSEAGVDEISYAGPSDIGDALGRQLQPFEGMAL